MICEKCEYPLLTPEDVENDFCPLCKSIAKIKAIHAKNSLLVLDEIENLPDSVKEMMRDSHDPKGRIKVISAPRSSDPKIAKLLNDVLGPEDDEKTKHELLLSFLDGGSISITLFSEAKELNRRLTFQDHQFVWDMTSKDVCFFREIEILDLQKELEKQDETVQMQVEEPDDILDEPDEDTAPTEGKDELIAKQKCQLFDEQNFYLMSFTKTNTKFHTYMTYHERLYVYRNTHEESGVLNYHPEKVYHIIG